MVVVKPVLADLLSKTMPGQAQTAETNRSVIDQTFEEVFNSLEKTVNDRKDKTSKDPGKNNGVRYERVDSDKTSTSKENSGNDKGAEVMETRAENNRNDEMNRAEDSQKAVARNVSESAREPEESVTDSSEKEKLVDALQQVADKVNELLISDPKALEELLAGIETMTFRDLLTALGMDNGDMDSLSKIIDLDKKLPEEAVRALLAGKPGAFLQALKNISPNNALLDEIFAALKETAESLKGGGVNKIDLSKNAQKAKNGENAPNNENQQAKSNNQTNQTLKQNNGAEASAPSSQQGQTKSAGVNGAKASPQVMDVNVSGDSLKRADVAQAATKRTGSSSSAFERMLMTQIVDKARIHVRSNGQSNIILKLDPPSLGKIDMRIVTQGNAVRAVMLVESREVKMAVESNLESLKSSLNNAGLKVDQISVNLQGEGFNFRNENLAKDSGPRNRSKQNRVTRSGGAEFGDNEMVLDKTASKVHNGLLDVVA